MPHVKYASKRKRTKKALPVLGVVGISLSLAGGASAGTGKPATDIPSRNIAPSHEVTLYEEELYDVSLGTFFVFDKEGAGTPRLAEKFARGGTGASPGGTGGRCAATGASPGGTGGRCGCGGCTGTGCGCARRRRRRRRRRLRRRRRRRLRKLRRRRLRSRRLRRRWLLFDGGSLPHLLDSNAPIRLTSAGRYGRVRPARGRWRRPRNTKTVASAISLADWDNKEGCPEMSRRARGRTGTFVAARGSVSGAGPSLHFSLPMTDCRFRSRADVSGIAPESDRSRERAEIIQPMVSAIV